MSFNVNASLFRIAHMAVSTEETRYYLKGVYIEPYAPGGVTLTATNGHMLLTIHDESGSCDAPVIVSLGKSALTECKTPRKEKGDRRLTGDAASEPAQIIRSNMEGSPLELVAVAPQWHVDGTFPDWRRVVPRDASPGVSAAFDPVYIRRFADIAEALDANGKTAVRIAGADNASPALVQFEGVPYAVGALMPMRTNFDGLTAPAFAVYS